LNDGQVVQFGPITVEAPAPKETSTT
jgi:hypothetical protein